VKRRKPQSNSKRRNNSALPAPVNGGINLSLTNTTSFKSLTYDMGPQWQRGSFPTPMGNTRQTYNITATCK